MSTTSQKHRNFVSEPLKEKAVTELPGVGAVYAKRLVDAGFDYAYQVLGQFLIMKMDAELFEEWFIMTTECRGNNHAKQCFNGLKEWAENFI